MANSKISALTSATTPLAGTETLPIVQSSTTKQVSVANLTAGRSPTMNYAVTQNGVIFQNSGVNRWILEREAAAGDNLYIYRYNDAGGYAGNPLLISRSNGNVSIENNLVIRTSGNGIDFSATAGTGTSELLADYEEGTWTPTITAALGTGYSTAVYAARYTKFGRLVTVTLNVQVTAAGTASGVMNISGLPFTAVANINPVGSCYEAVGGSAYLVRGAASAATATITTTLGGGILWAYATQYYFTMTYEAA
jgi:hypothetical protein